MVYDRENIIMEYRLEQTSKINEIVKFCESAPRVVVQVNCSVISEEKSHSSDVGGNCKLYIKQYDQRFKHDICLIQVALYTYYHEIPAGIELQACEMQCARSKMPSETFILVNNGQGIFMLFSVTALQKSRSKQLVASPGTYSRARAIKMFHCAIIKITALCRRSRYQLV